METSRKQHLNKAHKAPIPSPTPPEWLEPGNTHPRPLVGETRKRGEITDHSQGTGTRRSNANGTPNVLQKEPVPGLKSHLASDLTYQLPCGLSVLIRKTWDNDPNSTEVLRRLKR